MEFFNQTITVTISFLHLTIYLGIGLLLDWIVAIVSKGVANAANDSDLNAHGLTATLMIVPAWPFAILGVILTMIFGKKD